MQCRTGMEIDLIVQDSLQALALYERIFPVACVEVTALPRGQNEAIFTIYGTRLHLLDEAPGFQMFAPEQGMVLPFWMNVAVPDIEQTWACAMRAGCTAIQPVTALPEMGVHNAMFSDPFGYVWMLHQIDREVSLAERMRIMEQSQA